MSMEDIEMFSKHFASSLDVVIEFKENANPCTDGRTIILPKNMNKEILFEMLATLIHETFHIRFTNMTHYTGYASRGPGFAETLNVVEDIRIDDKAFKLYPECKDLYFMLYKYVLKSIENLKKEPQAIRILKHMILKHKANKNKEFAEFYYDTDALKIIEKLKLDEEINSAIKCRGTKEATIVADTVMKKITGFIKDNKSGARNDPEFDKNNSTLDGFKSQLSEKIKELNEKLEKEKENMNSLNAERKQNNEEIIKAVSKTNEAQRAFSNAVSTNIYNPTDKNKQAEAEAREELAKANEEKDNLINKDHEIYIKTKELLEKAEEVKNGIRNLEYKKQNATEQNQEIIFGNGLSQNLNGFGAIKPDDVTSNENYDKIKLERSLDEDLREFFVQKREERLNDEEGNRLDAKRLHRLFVNDGNIFTEQHEKEYKTKVLFLVDSSGSMSQRANLIKQTFSSLITALNRILNEDNLPIETAVLSFDDRVEVLKEFESIKTPKEIVDKYWCKGGTCFLQGYRKAVEMLEASGEDCEKVLICMTDGEVNSFEIDEVNNSATDIKTLFIGIDVNTYDKKCKSLFGKYNVKDFDNILHVLTTAIKESVR